MHAPVVVAPIAPPQFIPNPQYIQAQQQQQFGQPNVQPLMQPGMPSMNPMGVVCIQQPNGQCSFVQAPQQASVPDPAAAMQTGGSLISTANPSPTTVKSEFALQFIMFLLTDAAKVHYW